MSVCECCKKKKEEIVIDGIEKVEVVHSKCDLLTAYDMVIDDLDKSSRFKDKILYESVKLLQKRACRIYWNKIDGND